MAEGGDRPGVETILTDDPRPDASAAPSEPHLERGATLGRHIVVERIGGGGMGVVYAAYDPALDRKVALKLLRASSFGDPERRRTRLLREGQALARLARPNVVAVHDVGAWEDRVLPLERALAIREKQRVDAAALAATRLSPARALWQGGGDRARARTLAEAAAAGPLPTEARDWLATRR